jgi:hypothetical protein
VYFNSYSDDFEIRLYLTVTDSLGNTCVDSVNIFNPSGFFADEMVYGETIVQGDSVWMQDTIYGGAEPLIFFWEPSYGLTNPFSNGTWASPDTTTSYWLHVTDAYGCQFSKYSYEIDVQGSSDASVLAASSGKLAVFPNPTSDFLSINLNCPESNTVVSLYNTQGVLVYQQQVASGTETFTLDVSPFPAGLYVVEVLCGGRRYVEQVTVIR